MPPTPTMLEHLTDSDWSLLLGRARRRSFRRGETILREGDSQLALFLVRRGFARVEREEQGSGIAINCLGPGEIFGEMSFLEGVGASASVIADDDVEVEVIDGGAVQSLLVSDPGLSARFYRSLALTLSSRLRRLSGELARLRLSDMPNAGRRPTLRTGHVQERQIPAELAQAVREFRESVQDTTAALARGAMREDAAQASVSVSCDALLETLARQTDYEALVTAGIEDPFAFRDPAELEAGFGAYVFREAFSIFMASASLAHCYAKPNGYPDDWETMWRIHRDEPEGEGRLGVLVDRWFLSRPICRTIRGSRDWMASFLVATADAASGHPIAVTSAAGRPASELLDAMSARPGAFRATCLDGDPAALRQGAQLARRLGVDGLVSFVSASVARVAAGEAGLSLPPQHLIYALGLCEYLDDAQVVQLLDWAHAALVPGGALVVSQLAPPDADRVLMEHILEWHVLGRTEATLRELVGRSAFGRGATASETEIVPDAERGTWFVRCVRA